MTVLERVPIVFAEESSELNNRFVIDIIPDYRDVENEHQKAWYVTLEFGHIGHEQNVRLDEIEIKNENLSFVENDFYPRIKQKIVTEAMKPLKNLIFTFSIMVNDIRSVSYTVEIDTDRNILYGLTIEN